MDDEKAFDMHPRYTRDTDNPPHREEWRDAGDIEVSRKCDRNRMTAPLSAAVILDYRLLLVSIRSLEIPINSGNIVQSGVEIIQST